MVLEAWTELSSGSTFTNSFLASDLMFPQRLVKLRGIILARPFINETKLVNAGRAQADEDKTRNEQFLQSRKKAKVTKKYAVEENARETRKAEEAARQNQDKVLEMQNELRLVTQKQGSSASITAHKDSGDAVFARRSNPTWQLHASKTALANARVITSRSSKLNYLLKEACIS
jgi:hypothetical protein